MDYKNNDVELLLNEMLAEAETDVVEGRVAPIEEMFRNIRAFLEMGMQQYK